MSQVNKPLFSIITVTYNAERTIRRTVESIAKQTCTLYEHIIVDGLSKDSTLDIIGEYDNGRTVILSEKDNGIYDAMNRGLTMAQGEYVIFLNAGDSLHSENTLQHYADAIMDNDFPGIVYGQTVLVDEEGKELGPRHLKAPERLTLDSFKEGMVVCHQAMVVYHKIAPLYNLNYRYSSDYEWAIICLQHSKRNVYLPEVTVDYLSEGMTTANHKESLKERFKIMCCYFGTVPTIYRHFKFAGRYVSRRKEAPNIQ